MHDRTMMLSDYLAAPMVADPLRVPDCCLISDGGAAFVTTSSERARDLRQRPAVVAGVGQGVSGTGYEWSQQQAFTSTPQEYAAPGAFVMARLRPADVGVLAVYDPFTILSLIQIEDMGFCAKGEGGPFVTGGRLDYDGGMLPYNTHGGLLSHAYVLGIAHVVELVKQLRGVAAAQVPGCEVAAYGGYTGGDAATLILTRGD
jgi:acetyl-CoA acetyltransferase